MELYFIYFLDEYIISYDEFSCIVSFYHKPTMLVKIAPVESTSAIFDHPREHPALYRLIYHLNDVKYSKSKIFVFTMETHHGRSLYG